MTDQILLFFTDSYPYDVSIEKTFVEPQLRALGAAFSRVFVIPSRRGGSRDAVPPGIEVVESLADRQQASGVRATVLLRALRSGLLRDDLTGSPWILKSPVALRRLIGATGRAELIGDWLRQFLASRRLDPEQCVGYSFWFDASTVGMALVKSHTPELVVVTRTNGADILLENHSPPFIPNREFSLKHVDRIFAASRFANAYAAERYPHVASRCEVAHLGVSDPGFVASRSAASRFVLVSCSGLIPLKRVDLILSGVTRAAELRPNTSFEWHHFGGGPQRQELQHQASALPSNLAAEFHGHIPPSEIMAFYQGHPVDLFVNTSTREGGAPVSIMEAVSCGIPVVATAAGGTSDIVTDANGLLIKVDLMPNELAGAVITLVDDRSRLNDLSDAGRRLWRERFHAETNYQRFARRLVDLRKAPREGTTSRHAG